MASQHHLWRREFLTKEQLVRRTLTASTALCYVTMLIALSVAAGWIFGIPLLIRWGPTLPAMQPTTAFGLSLGALAVLLMREGVPARVRSAIVRLLASAILLLGLLLLVEFAFGWNVGIDRLFVHSVPTATRSFPGRPSLQVAANFILLGIALLSFDLDVGLIYLGQTSAILMVANALVAATGYIFDVRAFYGFPIYVPAVGMAVHSAISSVLLVVALLCARPDSGLMTLVTSDTRGGSMVRRILITALLAPPFVGLLTRLGVAGGKYDVGVQVSLFAAVMIGLIVRTTWRTARQAEHEELQARAASEALEQSNNNLSRALDERRIFTALIENSSDFIGIADPDGTPVYLNPAGRRMVGLASDFPVGQTTISEYYPPDQRTFATDVIVKSMVERGHWEGETVFRHWQTETTIPVSDTHFAIRDAGRTLGFGTVTRDVSDIKHAREASEMALRQVEDVAEASMAASEAIAGLPESSVLSVLQTIALKGQNLTSAEFAAVGIGGDTKRPFEIFAFSGITQEQAVKMGRFPRPVGLLGIVSKADTAVRLRDVREHREHYGFPAGHPVMTSFLGVPIRHSGRPVGNLYLANKRGAPEFTEQDQHLAEMLAAKVGGAIETARLYALEGIQHAWLQAVIDQMLEGIILMDADGRVTVENRFAHSLAGAKPENRDRFENPSTLDLRRPSGEQLSADDLPIVRAFVHKEVVHGQELVARRADGRFVSLMVSASPVWEAKGTLAGATMILQDISTLQELERLREEWSSIVAHDLKHPISTILLRSDLLLRGSLTAEQAENVRQIRGTTKRLARMVTDLMDASLLETNRMQITLDRLDLGALVRGIVEGMPDARSRTNIRTPVECRPLVRGDAQRLEQIVTNILSNALKYGSPDADIRLDVGIHDGSAQVSVMNRGPGISPDELSFIFERYARTRAARTMATEGAGLGLYITKGLVEAHGGRIWVESVPGETTFHFTVPLDDTPPVEAATRSLAAGDGASGPERARVRQ